MQDELTPQVALWAGACVAALGSLAVAWGLRAIVRGRRRIAEGHRTTGTVVENRISTDMENSTLVHPIVEFSTPDGRTFRVECSWSTEVKYPVGAAVPVCYDPERPDDADIIGATRVGTLLLTAFAATVTAGGLLLLVLGALGFPPSH